MSQTEIDHTRNNNSLILSLGFKIIDYSSESITFSSKENKFTIIHRIKRTGIIEFLNNHFKGRILFKLIKKDPMDLTSKDVSIPVNMKYDISYNNPTGGLKSRMHN